MNTLFKQLINFIIPRRCLQCFTKATMSYDLCASCQQQLPLIKHGCHSCGRAINNSASTCGECLAHPPPYQHTIATLEYQNSVKDMIAQIKFGGQLAPTKLLGELMTEKLVDFYLNHPIPEAILPVPLHHSRLKERGFNQAIEIAKPIAKTFKLPILRHHVIREKATQAQATLPYKHRQKNLSNAFKIKKPLNYQHIAILDDVYTTGTTLKTLSKAIKKSQDIKIDIWVAARAIKH